MDTKIIGDRPHHQYNSPLIAYLEMSTLSVFILFILSSFLSESGCPGFKDLQDLITIMCIFIQN